MKITHSQRKWLNHILKDFIELYNGIPDMDPPISPGFWTRAEIRRFILEVLRNDEYSDEDRGWLLDLRKFYIQEKG